MIACPLIFSLTDLNFDYTHCDREAAPQNIKDALFVHFFTYKGNRYICDNHYYGISLLAIAGKTLAKIILNRLTAAIVDEVILESQCGFHALPATTDMLFSTRKEEEKCVEKNMELFISEPFDVGNGTKQGCVMAPCFSALCFQPCAIMPVRNVIKV